MKNVAFVLLLASIAMADDQPTDFGSSFLNGYYKGRQYRLEKEKQRLEQERLDLERERLQLERERLEQDRQKTKNQDEDNSK